MNNDVLAVVAGKEIKHADVDAFLEALPEDKKQFASNPYFRKTYEEQLINLYVLEQFADECHLDENEEYIKTVESLLRDIKSRMATIEIVKNVTVTDEEVEAFYNENKAEFEKPDTVRAKHILVESEEACKAALLVIEKDLKTFEECAMEVSTCPSKENGGDLGEFGRGQMVKEFEDAAFDAEIGKIVGPVKTQFGYHLILVEEKNEAHMMSLEEASSQIKTMLMQQKQQQTYTEKLAELKEKYVQRA